jgi:hypothetical protein
LGVTLDPHGQTSLAPLREITASRVPATRDGKSLRTRDECIFDKIEFAVIGQGVRGNLRGPQHLYFSIVREASIHLQAPPPHLDDAWLRPIVIYRNEPATQLDLTVVVESGRESRRRSHIHALIVRECAAAGRVPRASEKAKPSKIRKCTVSLKGNVSAVPIK